MVLPTKVTLIHQTKEYPMSSQTWMNGEKTDRRWRARARKNGRGKDPCLEFSLRLSIEMQIGPIEASLDWIWLNATFFIPDWHLKEKISAQKWGLKMVEGGKKTSFSWKNCHSWARIIKVENYILMWNESTVQCRSVFVVQRAG